MGDKKFIFIIGGARSGKSELALTLCEAVKGPRVYLATAEPLDKEMEKRINAHKERRGEAWATIEEPLDPASRIGELKDGVVVLDCLTLWLSNLIHASIDDDNILEEVSRLARTCKGPGATVIAVSNEVGLGVIADNPLSRRFTDISGFANQRMARAADEVFFVAAGLHFRMK